MNWNELLQPLRYGDKEPRKHDASSARSIFEQDYDRIIFSTPFRRLQDKTQVIPLPEKDFVHNRLTHSIEVSSVGRTLGKIAGRSLLESNPALQQKLSFHDLGAIVAAACLAHDIGNPPFGHSGEAAIGAYFLEGNGKQFKSFLSPAEWEDLTRFEGNANGFKIISNPYHKGNGGLRLTYPTLAAFTKYPKESLPVYDKPLASQKKFGFFQSEKTLYEDVALNLGIPSLGQNGFAEYQRHPFVYLVEAADDICYQIIDFEDGLSLGWIDFKYAEELLIPIAGDAFYVNSYKQLSSREERAGYLRAVAINNLVKEMAASFMQHEQGLLSGTFNRSLISGSKFKPQLDEVKKLSLEKIYKARQVIEIEAAGFEIIAGLLDYFAEAVLAAKVKGNTGMKQRKLLELLPAEVTNAEASIYQMLLNVCAYVAGLTDKHAITLFRRLKGIELPG
ncbi:MAG: deoxyguanosinetriphosphate triphosphohydrolase [Bacteroidetes bacterium]|nr:deoxyguanosinetriphosphate triphosphohydrolase [Bacteroidota bacterium]